MYPESHLLLQPVDGTVMDSICFPVRHHHQDAGLDLFIREDTWLWPFRMVDLPTGWRVKVPDGHVGIILPRSSTFVRTRITVHTGIIDASYTGELSVLVRNQSFIPRLVRRKTRLAQLLILPCYLLNPIPSPSMPPTDRGRRGFGSTG